MENISISLSESGQDRSVSEIRVDGVIDTLTAGELEEVIDSLLKRGRYKIVFDLAGVDYISSAGWGIFISHIKEVRGRGGDIKLANMIPNVYEIYQLLEFDNVLQAFESIDDARSRFDTSPADGGLKKKDRQVTHLTVIDELASGREQYGSTATLVDDPRVAVVPESPETRVLLAVKNDPFATISELKREVNRRPGTEILGWWRIFAILRSNGLLSRRARFQFVRRHY
ncbi:MAG: STAS domain-containing protein [bacterium]|nr:STAS domain-containing protein [bacterium]